MPRAADVISALSYALDLTEGRPMGHAVRSCLIGMRLAAHIGLPRAEWSDLYYALLLKDSGCSSNASKMHHLMNVDDIAAKTEMRLTDWTRMGWDTMRMAMSQVATGRPFLGRMAALMRVAATRKRTTGELMQIRCERGASVARQMGFSEATATAVRHLDELWSGDGYPDGLAGERIPLLSRIMNLAQTMEAFASARGIREAMKIAEARSGSWFDPSLVKAARSIEKTGELWAGFDSGDLQSDVAALEPAERRMEWDDRALDGVCQAFAEVIDAKSPFTYRHSTGVAEAAVGICRQLGATTEQTTFLRRAALLHDIGKLSVPNTILEKPGKLTAEEWEVMKRHPHYTFEILVRIPGFEELAEVAASHHERLDGSGYHRGLDATQLSVPCRVLAVADVYDALAAKRPYRDALPREEVLAIMRRDTPRALDATCLEALEAAVSPAASAADTLHALASSIRDTATDPVPERATN